ncbi:IclR family transcriptional regulator [Agrobacterium pusense]|uniref:IclR family transcriptional regulator n=1 Tax=Agrobacterium pusense TaxID=648995 RepID=UPI003FD671F4
MSSARETRPEPEVSGGIENSVPALRRAVMILDLVAKADTALLAADITRALSLPKSTAHGLMNVMIELNLLTKDANGAIRLGPHPLHWANSFLADMDIVSAFQSYFSTDTSLSKYTLTMTVLDGSDVVYVGCRNSDRPMGLTFRIGMRLPAAFTATGKMLLSEIADQDLTSMFYKGLPAPMTVHSVRSLEQLRTELHQTRVRGYSIDNEQVRDGILCIGSTVRDYSGKAVAGVAVSLLRSEASDDYIVELGLRVRNIAGSLSARLGG